MRPLWSGEGDVAHVTDVSSLSHEESRQQPDPPPRDRSSKRSGRPINDHIALRPRKSLITEMLRSRWSFNEDFNLHTSQMVARVLLGREVGSHVQAGCFKVNCTLILFI